MRVWLVWKDHYSAASVVGVYSSVALARSAASMTDDGWIDDDNGYEVDADAVHVIDGIGRWTVSFEADGNLATYSPVQNSPGTGESPHVRWWNTLYCQPELVGIVVECDARDAEHAVKIASDERAVFLATTIPR